MSKADVAAEKAAYTDKFFACAESIIQEWIADYLQKPVTELFTDYQDESDVIGFMLNKKQYSAYLVTMPYGTECLIDKAILNVDEKAKKACSMLYDAVREVFMAVTGSLAESKVWNLAEINNIRSLMPVFTESNMAFHIVRVNRKAMRLQVANSHRMQLLQFLQNAEVNGVNGVTEEQKNAIQKGLDELNMILAENTKEVLDAEEVLCKEVNEKNKLGNMLHIVLEESDLDDLEIVNQSMKRLPMFGLQFQDPDEENYIDKLKRENDVD